MQLYNTLEYSMHVQHVVFFVSSLLTSHLYFMTSFEKFILMYLTGIVLLPLVKSSLLQVIFCEFDDGHKFEVLDLLCFVRIVQGTNSSDVINRGTPSKTIPLFSSVKSPKNWQNCQKCTHVHQTTSTLDIKSIFVLPNRLEFPS